MHLRDYIESLKSKPEHVRQRYALGASAGLTIVVFLAWAVALGASGTLALAPANDADVAPIVAGADEAKSSFNNLLGAASAFQAVSKGEPALTIVDARASSTLDQPKDANEGKTVLPF